MSLTELKDGFIRQLAAIREINRNDVEAISREFKSDGTVKSAEEVAKEAKADLKRVGNGLV